MGQILSKIQIKLKVIDWWNDPTLENFDANPFIKLLRQKYEIIYSDEPDFVLCGPFGNAHLDYDCVKIYYTGENLRVDWNLYDYGMGFDYMDFGERYLRLPLFFIYNYDFAKRDLGERKRFCAYIVRHSGANEWGANGGLRDRFFDKLSAYKRVDSGGGWRNNIGGAVKNKHSWLQDYKFNICFENSSSPGYLTEKLFDAYNAGCVPIYWGDTSLNCGNSSSLAQSLRELEKSLSHRPLVLSHSDFSAQPTNLAQDTIIAECVDSSKSDSNKSKLSPSLACGDSNASPSLAEGVRGWVKQLSSLRDAQSEASATKQFVECANEVKQPSTLKNALENIMGGGNRTYNPHDLNSQNLDKIDMRIPRISPHLLEYKINPKAFINAHNFPNLDALVAEVERIDNDDIAYNAMRNEPIFLDDFNPKTFYEKRILEFFDNIFSQNPNLAFRRSEGQHLHNYRAKIANIDKVPSLGKDAINLAKFYDKIHKATRKVRYKLKFWR